MTTVGFDATSAARQSAGIGRYTRALLVALSALDDGTNFNLFYWSRGLLEGSLPVLNARFKVRAVPLSDRVANALWYRVGLPVPVQFLTRRIDVFHSPDFTLPPTMHTPTVLTVHDLAFLRTPECAYPTLRAYLEMVVPRSARRATRIIAVSDNTRQDCIDLLGIEPNRITTVYEGVSAHFHPVSREMADSTVRSMGIEDPYILSVGTLEPRKNYVRLLEAFALLRERGFRHRLVIAGRPGWLFAPIHAAVDRLRLEECVSFVQPADDQLRALYGDAHAFVYPSLYEGFGLPLAEAMACGTPVACSTSSSLPEVVGDCAVLFDPLDIEDIAVSIQRVVEDRALASSLADKGLRRAAQFTWERAARATLQVYEQAQHA